MPKTTELSACIPDTLAGQRLDQALAALFPDYSRSRLQQWIRSGQVRVDACVKPPRARVLGGEEVRITAILDEAVADLPEAIPLAILYADESLLVLNKPAGLVMHPAAGNRSGTLQNALLHYDSVQVLLPRAGIVHRLDKDTSGVLVVARTIQAHQHLVAALQARTVRREYEAVVQGVVTAGGTLDDPIGRHPRDRKRMAVVTRGGKPAVTHFRVLQRYRAHTHVRVQLETGRTHQIRVHLAQAGYPLVGDPVYGGRLRIPKGASTVLADTLRGFRRQALHAAQLRLQHPASGEDMQWQAPLPEDFQQLLRVLARDMQDASQP